MKNVLYSFATAAAFFGAGPALAAEQTATIEVTGLWCSSCPYIAAQAVTDLPSAEIIDGFYDPKLQLAQFVVQFDDEMTTLAAVVGATEEYGYPASLVPADAGDS